MESIRAHFRRKHRHTFWVSDESCGRGHDEEFHFTDVTITSGSDYMRFKDLVEEGLITEDFTLTYRYGRNGNVLPRNHGYPWKASPKGRNQLFFSSMNRHLDLTE